MYSRCVQQECVCVCVCVSTRVHSQLMMVWHKPRASCCNALSAHWSGRLGVRVCVCVCARALVAGQRVPYFVLYASDQSLIRSSAGTTEASALTWSGVRIWEGSPMKRIVWRPATRLRGTAMALNSTHTHTHTHTCKVKTLRARANSHMDACMGGGAPAGIGFLSA